MADIEAEPGGVVLAGRSKPIDFDFQYVTVTKSQPPPASAKPRTATGSLSAPQCLDARLRVQPANNEGSNLVHRVQPGTRPRADTCLNDKIKRASAPAIPLLGFPHEMGRVKNRGNGHQ